MPRRPAAALVAAVLLAVAGCAGSGAPRAAGWRVVYRVDDHAGPTPRVTTLVVEVLPPYGARSLSYDGPPPGRDPLGGAAWTEGEQYVVDANGTARQVAAVAPGFAGPDAHLDVALAAALAHGLVRRAGTATVAGLSCREWLSQEPLDAGAMSPPTAGESTTSCVDGRGRLLRDAWTLSGRVIRSRTAVSVGAPRDAALAGLSPSLAPGDQLPVLVKRVDAARLATALGIAVPSAPAGLRPAGAAALLEQDLAQGTGPLREGGAFVWRDARRMVTLQLERGLQQPERAPTDGVPVRLASGLAARLLPVVNGLQVELLTPAGLLVTALGDLPEPALLAWLGAQRWDRAAGPAG